MSSSHRYIYDGPVCSFGKCIDNRWYGETIAVTSTRALSNLQFRYKQQTNRTANTRIELLAKYLKEE